MTPFLGSRERLVLIRDGYYSIDPRRSRRAAALLALDRGVPAAAIARQCGCSRATVYAWLHLYKQYRDPAALSPGQPRRRPTPEEQSEAARLVNALEWEPVAGWPPMSERAREALRRDALHHRDPGRRLASAMAWAIERGVSPTRVGLALGISRQGVHSAWKRRRIALIALRERD